MARKYIHPTFLKKTKDEKVHRYAVRGQKNREKDREIEREREREKERERGKEREREVERERERDKKLYAEREIHSKRGKCYLVYYGYENV